MSQENKPASPTFQEAITSDTVLDRIVALRAPGKLRAMELMLLLFAVAIGVAGIIIVDLTVRGELSTTMLVPGLIYVAALFGLHIVVRLVASDADPLFVPIAAFLSSIGVIEIYRLDLANDKSGWSADSVRQLIWLAVAITIAAVVLIIVRNHLTLYRFTYLSGLGALVLLILPMVPGIGSEINGAKVWIRIGDSMSFQPGEIAKILLAIFFAGYLISNRDALAMAGKKVLGIVFPRGRDLGPLLVIWFTSIIVLIFQRDLGTSLLYFGLFLSTLYVATARKGWLVLGISLFLIGGIIASQVFSHVSTRFQNWFNPWADPQNSGYQMIQGLFGLANGGMLGTGLGGGFPEITPYAQSDYIFASLGEELGLVGLFMILLVYLIFVGRGLRVSFAGQDDFGKLLAMGLAFSIAFQVFIVLGGITRVIPLTGLTAPFLAAGGSSLVSNWIIVALLLRLSNAVRNRPKLVIRA
ncbi:FtsW/RodA/SpoVE family cell cycle protein [Leucobacter chinensis]|uniref:FtsW/RodA/SpoVE family cell cycle protein n=1 Tax=Leucobacter chinensis TaxID=2851010 RepID=UPI001C237099|nr:FtsW/RodA/SpoVE family cell cycle protein [Leucobacter chinensis]